MSATLSSAAPATPQTRPRRAINWRKTVLPWLFMAPLLILNLVVILGPSLASFGYAFTEWSGVGAAKFVGLENFKRMLGDRVFKQAFINNIEWTLIFLTVPICMGLLGATLLSQIKRFQYVFRVIYFIPYVLASIVVAQIWRYILHPNIGLGPWLENTFGWEWANISFFGDRDIVLYSIAFVDNWHWWGFLVVLYLAAMQAVDMELYECARLEGATRWQEFRFVTLPGIRPTLVFTLLMTVIWSMLVFDYIYQLTQGGPAHASEVLATEVYNAAFARFDVGYAAAIGVSMSLICGCVIFGFVMLRRRGWEV